LPGTLQLYLNFFIVSILIILLKHIKKILSKDVKFAVDFNGKKY
jgi:hypothetical protein